MTALGVSPPAASPTSCCCVPTGRSAESSPPAASSPPPPDPGLPHLSPNGKAPVGKLGRLLPHSATNGGDLWTSRAVVFPIRGQRGAACGQAGPSSSPFGDKWGRPVGKLGCLLPHSATNGEDQGQR